MHDPTDDGGQGPDRGSQYRSAIFTCNNANANVKADANKGEEGHGEEVEDQDRVAREVRDKVAKRWWTNGPVVTRIERAAVFWDAESYHQLYLDKNPGGYECPSHYIRSFPPLD